MIMGNNAYTVLKTVIIGLFTSKLSSIFISLAYQYMTPASIHQNEAFLSIIAYL